MNTSTELSVLITMQPYNGDFEVHATVCLTHPVSWEQFHTWCTQRQVKPVRILLARGEHVDQPMATWRRSRTRLPAVLSEALLVLNELQDAGFAVVRLKVEAAPFNQGIPQSDEEAGELPENNYFEHHIKLLRKRKAPCDRLLEICEERSAHLSQNAWREWRPGSEERFVTLRSYCCGRLRYVLRLKALLDALRMIGEQVIEVESEYCVYDSNLDLDRGWLPPVPPHQRVES